MRAQDKFDFIVFQKEPHSIWPKLDDVSSAIWVANEIWLYPQLLVTVSRITP